MFLAALWSLSTTRSHIQCAHWNVFEAPSVSFSRPHEPQVLLVYCSSHISIRVPGNSAHVPIPKTAPLFRSVYADPSTMRAFPCGEPGQMDDHCRSRMHRVVVLREIGASTAAGGRSAPSTHSKRVTVVDASAMQLVPHGSDMEAALRRCWPAEFLTEQDGRARFKADIARDSGPPRTIGGGSPTKEWLAQHAPDPDAPEAVSVCTTIALGEGLASSILAGLGMTI
jgi:hypothetical protein